MHGETETSNVPRATWVVAHLLILTTAYWLYFGGGIELVGGWFGRTWLSGNLGRRYLLMGFGVVMWLRMALTAFVLLRRRFDWSECVAVTLAAAVYQLGFALFGARTAAQIGAFDYAAVALFLIGSALNTGSEWQRERFKQDPANKGKLYTQGLFSVVRHPNYLGDILWVAAWGMLTRNWWAALIAAAAAAGFVFFFIPQLSNYLAGRYGNQYDEWAGRTRRLIPFLY
jgi:protein-S-isoprenylcysteine O-methyltransferase Ste14